MFSFPNENKSWCAALVLNSPLVLSNIINAKCCRISSISSKNYRNLRIQLESLKCLYIELYHSVLNACLMTRTDTSVLGLPGNLTWLVCVLAVHPSCALVAGQRSYPSRRDKCYPVCKVSMTSLISSWCCFLDGQGETWPSLGGAKSPLS